jgi:N-acetylmuramoyl-L-alanine amidase
MEKYHVVKQGDCLSSVAKRYGFRNYRTVYDHPKNAELRSKRPNPNILLPEDVVYIPENKLKEENGATEQQHRFVLKQERTVFRLMLKDSEEKPYANTPFELRIDNQIFQGKTDGNGKLEEKIKADAKFGEVTLYANENGESRILAIVPLELGHLDPIDAVTGVQARLSNLGFECGKVDGVLGKKTKEALRDFQTKHNLPVSGEPCVQTRSKLKQLHDWQ